jgi:hypothetical protein
LESNRTGYSLVRRRFPDPALDIAARVNSAYRARGRDFDFAWCKRIERRAGVRDADPRKIKRSIFAVDLAFDGSYAGDVEIGRSVEHGDSIGSPRLGITDQHLVDCRRVRTSETRGAGGGDH